MGLSYERKKEIAAMQLPDAQAATKIARDYMAATGLTLTTFARHVGCADNTLSMLFKGNYARISGTNKNVIAKIVKFVDAHPAGDGAQGAGKLYDTENVATLRQWFQYTLKNGKMVVVYGAPGSQKTFSMLALLEQLNRDELSKNGHGARAFYVYCSQDIRPSDLIRKIMQACALPAARSLQANLNSLRLFFRSRRVVFTFDEAQHLDMRCLEIVRELNDLPPYFGVMLLGSHKLRNFFSNRAGDLQQWESRIETVVSLPGISEERAAEIVRQELDGVKEFTATKMRTFLNGCMVQDVFSSKRGSAPEYLSARKLFNTIAGIKQAKAARQEAAQ